MNYLCDLGGEGAPGKVRGNPQAADHTRLERGSLGAGALRRTTGGVPFSCPPSPQVLLEPGWARMLESSVLHGIASNRHQVDAVTVSLAVRKVMSKVSPVHRHC